MHQSWKESMPWPERVRRWADDRNLIDGTTPAKQFGKLIEEYSELWIAVESDDRKGAEDAIGDMCVVIEIIAAKIHYGVDVASSVNILDSQQPNRKRCVQRLAEVMAQIAVNEDALTSVRGFSSHVDVAVELLARIAHTFGLTLRQCRESAWDEIKNRPGRMVNGVFVKETAQ